MSSPLQIGQIVLIKNVRTGKGEIYGAQVTAEDNGRFYVTKTNASGTNRMAPTHDPIPHALRFEDGSPCQDGEMYRITEIIGAPTDIVKSMQDTVKANTKLQDEIKVLKKELHDQNDTANRRLAAVINTLAKWVEDDMGIALVKSLSTSTVVSPPPSSVAPASRQPVLA